MKIQSINQNNYQNRNIGFNADVNGVLHLKYPCRQVCAKVRDTAIQRLLLLAEAKGEKIDLNDYTVLPQQTGSTLRLFLFDKIKSNVFDRFMDAKLGEGLKIIEEARQAPETVQIIIPENDICLDVILSSAKHIC